MSRFGESTSVSNSWSTEPASGLYDLVLSRFLDEQLPLLQARHVQAELQELDKGDSHTALTAHLRQLVNDALNSFSAKDRLPQQVDLCNKLVDLLAASAGEHLAPQAVATSAQRLLSIEDRVEPRATTSNPARTARGNRRSANATWPSFVPVKSRPGRPRKSSPSAHSILKADLLLA